MNKHMTYGCILSIVVAATAALAQMPPTYHTNNLAAATQRFETESAHYAANTNVLVLHGVRAERDTRRVILWSEATGLGSHDVAEFFIIAPHSGNDYEALLRSLATAGDLDKALQFIGLTPGRCVNYEQYYFWPKGERVNAAVRPWESDGEGQPIESFLLDEATGKPLPNDGLVYVQAPTNWVATTAEPNRHPVDADSRGSIAANYNETYTLFDVPRAAPQSAVYARQTVNPAHLFQPGERVDVVITPELPKDAVRVQDMTLTVHAASVATQSLADLTFTLTNHTAHTTLSAVGMNDLLERFAAVCKDQKDPFITLRIDDNVQMDAIKAFCLILASIETDAGIRIEPPRDRQLYYKAYMPDDTLRNREDRIMQPAELTFTYTTNATVAVSLMEITEHWHNDRIKPTLTFKIHSIDAPDALRAQLADSNDELPILLVFVPRVLTQGELMHWLNPVLPTHPTVHVFVEPDQRSRPNLRLSS